MCKCEVSIAGTLCVCTRAQVFHVELVVKAAELIFDPPLSELEAVIHRLISTIVEAAQGLPRVGTIPLSLDACLCVCTV